jgi:gamma-polyglutamate biosynthesis protein CapA
MKIVLLGDIALYGKYSVEGNDSVYDYFKDIANFLSQYDYVIGNLEAPFVDKGKKYGAKSAHIKSDIKNVDLLNFLNINVVNLANNHIYDYGKDGYLTTLNLLDKNNISYFGVEEKEVILSKGSNKVALNGYCGYSSNPLGVYSGKGCGVNELSIEKLEKVLKNNHEQGIFNIFSMHAGQEHVNYPDYNDILMARQLSKICPYVYYGHHPHVIQGAEEYNQSILAYSLGNFCFDDVYIDKSDVPLVKQSKNNKIAFMLEIELEENQVINIKKIPIYIGNESLSLNVNKDYIEKKLNEYSEKLKIDKSTYIKDRSKLIDTYINSRKSIRNFKWYLQRLKFKSVKMIFNAKFNSYKNKKLVLSKLNDN